MLNIYPRSLRCLKFGRESRRSRDRSFSLGGLEIDRSLGGLKTDHSLRGVKVAVWEI